MQSVTNNYLKDIISRAVNKTILAKRAIQNPSCYLYSNAATEQEINEFTQSIPFFNMKLKKFILGKPGDVTIVSQAWETMFVIKAKDWAESIDWLHSNPLLSIGSYTENIERTTDFLTLPW